MTDKMKIRLADLKDRQAAGEHMLCPRCGQDTMKPVLHTNALSRHADGIYVCDSCGTAEALPDYMKQELPLTLWAAFRPLCPASKCESMPAADVMEKVLHNQIETLTEIFKKCSAHPENSEEYRTEAWEKCPGLTELWTEPFMAQFDSKDNPVLLRFRMTDSGEVEYAADILGKNK